MWGRKGVVRGGERGSWDERDGQRPSTDAPVAQGRRQRRLSLCEWMCEARMRRSAPVGPTTWTHALSHLDNLGPEHHGERGCGLVCRVAVKFNQQREVGKGHLKEGKGGGECES